MMPLLLLLFLPGLQLYLKCHYLAGAIIAPANQKGEEQYEFIRN